MHNRITLEPKWGAAFRLAPLFAFVVFPGVVATAQTSEQTPEKQDSSFQISVDLNLVVLPVTVRDRKGAFAGDLTKENFAVYEDGVKQSIRLFRHEDIPVTAGIVVDHSGSMTGKIADVVAAAEKFADLSNPRDQMFVVNFNERASLGLPPNVRFTHFATLLREAIENAPAAGQTALYDALGLAIERLHDGKPDKKVLVVFSDGGDNASQMKLHDVLDKAAQSNAIVYTLGIFAKDDPDQNTGVLKRLAKESGGQAFFPEHYRDAAEICAEIAKEIRHQYMLGYVSSSTKSGGHRKLKVEAHAPGKDLTVRTRSGYEAAP
ncbi:MAG TPA: VWA domain-containing protein [Bryobacteraceae bacterium]|nr:VWA domain-containing protein [Bryobacteraceae bacterium]